MKLTFGSSFRPGGNIDRGAYALIGVVGFAIKHNLDRLVATLAFHRPWDLFNYWVPVRDVARITQVGGSEAVFLVTMVAISLPFIWVGVVLTMKRLRSAGLPVPLVALFFIPFLNLLFFLVLCLVPGRDAKERLRAAPTPNRSWMSFLPDSAVGSAAISLLVTVPIGLGIATLGTRVLANYGWGVFVALPYCMGFAATLIYGAQQPRSLSASVGVACLSVVLLGGALMAVAFEGLACIVMAAPIALPLAAFGGLGAYGVLRRRWLQNDAKAMFGVLLLLSPGVEGIEHMIAAPSPIFVVRSSIEIHASPEKVWQQVVAFSEIPPPREWLFRAGVAYPMRAEIAGTGVGAQRRCVFSTGAFVEPIQVWDEPHLLKFSVSSNPPPMEEWTPYKHVEPPHLHGYLVSEGGQFLLTPLPDGGTLLEGTTWYRHGLWPAAYWRVWSDAIIHRIHLRVLNHIRDEVEHAASHGNAE